MRSGTTKQRRPGRKSRQLRVASQLLAQVAHVAAEAGRHLVDRPDDEIADAIERAERDPQASGELLVEAANAQGGEDNITVVLFELVDGEPEPRVEQETPAAAEPPDEPEPTAPLDSPDGVRTHGAGPGGRLASLALIAAVLVLGLLGLYWGISK